MENHLSADTYTVSGGMLNPTHSLTQSIQTLLFEIFLV